MKHVLIILLCLLMQSALAKPKVYKPDESKKIQENGKYLTLKQIGKEFVVIRPDGTEEPKVKEVRIKANDILLIENKEKMFVHNIYDVTDRSWIITKQIPGEVHAVKFFDKKEHFLRCAIHPKMKIKIIVE